MANEFYTFIVVPHAKARFRKFQVSVRLTKWVLGTAVGLPLGLVALLAHYGWISVQVIELKRLRTENRALATKAQAYEQNAAKLQAKVLALQNTVTKLGMMAGLEKSLPDPQLGGVGGISGMETTAPSIDVAQSMKSLEQTVSHPAEKSTRPLAEQPTRLEGGCKDQKGLLASTPPVWPVRGYLPAGFGNRIDPFTGLRD